MFIECDQCGKEFEITTYRYERSKTHFCCKECSIAFKGRNKVHTNCIICGKEIVMNKSQYERHNHHCCSVECKSKYLEQKTRYYKRCEVCDKKMYISKKSTQRFCSKECQNEWQKTNIGENNKNFKREKLCCDYCCKKIYVKPYNIATYNNHFCSEECSRKYFSEVYSQQDFVREKSRNVALRMLNNGEFEHTNTKPQLIINNLLDDMNIKYQNEKVFNYYAVDNYIPSINGVIEVMGDYWHCSPIKYPNIKYDIHKKRIPKDKAKNTFLLNNYNINILYLWEEDIYNDINKCKYLIEEYIKNNQILENYNSFNYTVNGNRIVLNSNIIKSYQEMNCEEVKKFYI